LRYVIVDLEATCWEGVRGSPDMEIIEIGAAILSSAAGPIVDRFDSFIRPVVIPKLSEFCTRLTSIRQADVDGADYFRSVFPRFLDWIGPSPFVLCSWGAYDLNQFRSDCRRHGLELPESLENHINLKKEFARIRDVKICGMSRALEIERMPLVGTHHRAIDDAQNIARIAERLLPVLEAERRPS
jgi:inhibitor of KinA sporulation pathway (predicted exonuclease)